MKIELFRGLWTKDFHRADGTSRVDFKAWISSNKYQVNKVIESTVIELYINDSLSLNNTFAYDCSRMACAALETAHGISKANRFPKSTAWAAIRMYYAAFFAAHSILRIFGNTCSYLEKGHLTILQDSAAATASGYIKAEGGLFVGGHDCANKTFIIRKVSDPHKDTWIYFHGLLGTLSNDVLNVAGLSEDKQLLSAYLIDLRDALENGGRFSNGTWLSNFRNNINYKQDYGAWFPYEHNSITYDDIQRYMYAWREINGHVMMNLLEKNEIKRFIIVCSSILHLCKNLIVDVEKINQSRNSIHKKLPIAFLGRELTR